MINVNYLKEKMSKGMPVIGTWNTVGSSLVTEILARGGLDFIIIDFEHGLYQLDKAHEYVDKCESFKCSPIFRIPANNDWMALQVLDQGAHGIMVPHIQQVSDATYLSKAVKYYPKGERGFSPFTKAGGFTNIENKDYVGRANDLTLTSIIIESMSAIEQLDKILDVDGIDIVYFGAFDLSQDLGFPGDVMNPKLVEIIRSKIEKVKGAGKYAGAFVAQSKDDITRFLDMGMNFITWEVDTNIIYRSVLEMTEHFAKKSNL